jgi:hypothetical protein
MVDLARVKKWCDAGQLPESGEFFGALITEQGLFTDAEGLLWDFKETWPFSHSDPYWGGIARLICAFSNTLGGVIIFGVHDKKRNGGHNPVNVNADRLCQAFAQLTNATPQFDIKTYPSADYGDVVALLVPPRPQMASPYRFSRSVHQYPANILWVRDGHEVVKALPQHYPVLFCRSNEIVLNEGPSELAGSLPPSPTTLKKFVGRSAVLDKLFGWLSASDEPRTFIYGKGGSGKTAIAYEFAKLLKEHGTSRRLFGGYPIDSVVFLSAKEKQLVTATATVEDIAEPDFASESDLYKQILTYGGWTTSGNVESMTISELKVELTSFLDLSSSIIVIDDVDTLTTKGIDAGFDFLYRTLSRCRSGSKVLYTLRNAPSQSLLNSIEVPGLSQDGEYQTFVTACSAQFGVEEPKADFRDSVLAKESERRPLVVESIMVLRRTAGSYKRAVELFEQHAGADVRDYVFSREWDALSADNLARFLLLALAELGRPSSFSEIETILQAEPSRVTDAIGAIREMFLEIDAASDETLYSIAQLTKRFVLSKRESLTGYGVIRERVRTFKKYVFNASPEVAAIMITVDRLLPARGEYDQGDVSRAWALVADGALEPNVTEDPIFRSLRGYVASALRPPRLTEAREDFDYAVKMRYEPDFFRLKTWLIAEKQIEEFGGRVEHIANIVIDGKRYSRLEKAFMLQRKAGNHYFRAKDRQHTEPTDARRDFAEALKLQLKVFRINIDDGHHWVHATTDYARNSAFTLFDAVLRGPTPVEVVDEIRSLLVLKDIYLDPIVMPAAEAIERLVRLATRPEQAHRSRNRLKGLDQLVERSTEWCDPQRAINLARRIRECEATLKEGNLKVPG